MPPTVGPVSQLPQGRAHPARQTPALLATVAATQGRCVFNETQAGKFGTGTLKGAAGDAVLAFEIAERSNRFVGSLEHQENPSGGVLLVRIARKQNRSKVRDIVNIADPPGNKGDLG